MKQVTPNRVFNLLAVAMTLAAVMIGSAERSWAAPYDLIVMGDMNLFPSDTVNAGDIAPYADCINGVTACPPGADMGGFPVNTVTSADFAIYLIRVNGGLPWSLPPSGGFVDFTPLGSNPLTGDGTFGVTVSSKAVSGYGTSGLHNLRGELQVHVDILSDTTFGASLSTNLVTTAGPNVTAGPGAAPNADILTDVTCGATPGLVTLRFYVRATLYEPLFVGNEVCAGSSICSAGEHLDQLDVVVDCRCGDGTPNGAEVCDDGPGEGEGACLDDCSGIQTCGDSATNGTEVCDDGDTLSNGEGFCVADCSAIQICNDGVQNGTEICDDPGGNGGTECGCQTDCNYTLGGTVCGAADVCEEDDTCDGAGTCVDNGFKAVGTVCRPGSGDVCDPDETCNGAFPGCPSDFFETSAFVCRSATDLCDVDEVCPGAAGGSCPADDVLPGGTVCNVGTGVCDPDDTCDGVGKSCSLNYALAGTVCNLAAGTCDYDDTCDGGGFCLDNGMVPVGTVCRTGSGDFCDPDETCNGFGPVCPSDWVELAGTPCRPAVDLCDAEETCTGNVGETCPTDAIEPAGTVCRADADGPAPSGGCDAEEVCDGLTIACPADDIEVDDTECFGGDPNFCQNGDCGYCGDGFANGYEACDDFPHDPGALGLENFGGGSAISVDVDGSYAYLAKQAAGVRIIDVSNVFSPFFITNIFTSGQAQDVDVENGLAYIATSSGLEIYDVSFPGSPFWVNNDLVIGNGVGVDYANGFAYVATGVNGLRIFDVTDPYGIVLATTYPTGNFTEDVHVIGTTAYVADGGAGVTMLDVSDPYAPLLLGNFPGVAYAYDVVVRDGLAYIADGSGLKIVDVSDPASPSLLGSYVTTGTASDLAVWGNLAVVADWESSEAVLFDIGTPSAPTPIGSYNSGGFFVRGVAALGPYAYVAQSGDGLRILDLSQDGLCELDCGGAQICGDGSTTGTEYCDDGVNNDAGDGWCLFPCMERQNCGDGVVNGGEACDDGLLNGSGNGYCVSDCSTVQLCGNGVPEGTEFCDDGVPGNGSGEGFCITDCSAVQICGDTVTNGSEACDDGDTVSNGEGFCVADCSAVQTCGDGVPNGTEFCDDFPHSPGIEGLEATGVGPAWNSVVDGNYAYVAKKQGGLLIVDVSFPGAPFYVSITGTSGDANDVSLDDNFYAYLATASGLEIFDVIVPGAPSSTGADLTLGACEGVQVVNGYAYLACGANGLEILDVSNPFSPSQVGNWPAGDSANDVFIEGNLAYISDGGSAMEIIDISTPSTPSFVGSFNGVIFANDIVVRDGAAYIADNGGLIAVDVNSPNSPALMGSLSVGGTPNSVALAGNLALVANWDASQVAMVDIGDPSNLFSLGYYDSSPSFAYGVTTDGSYAYVSQANGLRILDINQDGFCSSGCSTYQSCGNAVPEGTEYCDDGANNGGGDGFCDFGCLSVQVCGDGTVDGTETCDDGALNGSGDGYCLSDCSGWQSCGDGIVNGAEACDWSSPQFDACCDHTGCTWVPYGADPSEECGGGTDCQASACDGAGGCTTIDQPAGTPCGQGIFEPTCDPDQCDGIGNCNDNAPLSDGSVCSDNGGALCCAGGCVNECCGDGALQGSEVCDDGALNGQPDQCDAYCTGTCLFSHNWSYRYGDASNQTVTDMVVDNFGNIIIVGYFQGSIDFGGGSLTSQGGDDMFIAKFDLSGFDIWSYSFGSFGNEYATAVDVDSSNNIYVGGYHDGNFNISSCGFVSASAGYDAFLSKFSQGGSCMWTNDFDDNNATILEDVSVGPGGAGDIVVITGSMSGTFDNFGGSYLSTNGGWDVFAAAFNPSGFHNGSNNWGGTGNDYGKGVEVDPSSSGIVNLTGYFDSGSIDFGGGSKFNAGGMDMFLTQQESFGGPFTEMWSEVYGDASDQMATNIDGNDYGDIFVTGDFQGTITFDSALSATGSSDAFLASFDSFGGINWSQSFGGSAGSTTSIAGLAAADFGELAITGSLDNSVDFGGGLLSTSGLDDLFAVYFDAAGVYYWGRAAGSAGTNETGSAIDHGSGGDVVLAGSPIGNIDLGGGILFQNGAQDVALGAFYEQGSPACQVCGDGTQDPGEACDDGALNGTTPCGCQNDCNLASVGTVCSGAVGLCDYDDTCDGFGTCIDNGVVPGATLCRADTDGATPAGGCDIDDYCDGASGICVDDSEPDFTTCLGGAGTCWLGVCGP